MAAQVAGQIHFVDNPARAPQTCHFRSAGMVVCQRHFGRVERGQADPIQYLVGPASPSQPA